MSDTVEVFYGDALLTPSPIIRNIVKNFVLDQSNRIIGYSYDIVVEGHIYERNNSGLANVVNSLEELNTVFSCNNKAFVVKCNGTVILSFCPVIRSINYDTLADNMVEHVPYTINMTTNYIYDFEEECGINNCLTSINDEWTVEPFDQINHYTLSGEPLPYLFRVIHTVAASAIDCPTNCDIDYSSSGVESPVTKGVIIAKEWVEDQLGEDQVSGVLLNIKSCFDNFQRKNYNRVTKSSETGGTYEISETWILAASGESFDFDVLDTFSVDIQETRDNPFVVVSVNGTIEGLEEVTYSGCYNVTTNKYENALNYYNTIKVSRIKDRAELISGLSLNALAASTSVAHNPSAGTISYTYTYDDTPAFCITGIPVYNENISVETQYPKDIYSEINVLGRTCPILQCLGIKTSSSKSLTIDVQTDPSEDCPSDAGYYTFPGSTEVENIVNAMYADLVSSYGSVFLSNNSESWSPKQGTYARNVVFTYTDCC